jgi:hypothetical protein
LHVCRTFFALTMHSLRLVFGYDTHLIRTPFVRVRIKCVSWSGNTALECGQLTLAILLYFDPSFEVSSLILRSPLQKKQIFRNLSYRSSLFVRFSSLILRYSSVILRSASLVVRSIFDPTSVQLRSSFAVLRSGANKSEEKRTKSKEGAKMPILWVEHYLKKWL